MENEKNKKHTGFGKSLLITIAIALVVGVIAAVVDLEPVKKEESESEKYLAQNDKYEFNAQIDAENVSSIGNVNAAAANVLPAMTQINIKGIQTSYDFFGFAHETETTGAGSGFIFAATKDYVYVATNNHVVDGATEVSVVFNDGCEYAAVVKGTNTKKDLAVVMVPTDSISIDTLQSIKVATIGDSDNVKLGETVIAVGNALGTGQSVTVGCISIIGKVIEQDGEDLEVLQTDAAINPGNSGGVLINAKGEVIGVNNAKIASTSVEGIGFSIPINTVNEVITTIANREELEVEERACLGIVGQNILSEDAKALNIPLGVYVKSIKAGSPAEQSGINAGAIITKINDEEVHSMEELLDVLDHTRGGSTGTVTLQELENGIYKTVTVVVVFGHQK